MTYKGPDNGVWHTTLAGILNQRFVKRETFFGGIDATYFIHPIPMSANTLYVGRNQAWLKATWKQYLLDTGAQGNPISRAVMKSSSQPGRHGCLRAARVLTGPGLTAALTRIARGPILSSSSAPIPWPSTGRTLTPYWDKWMHRSWPTLRHTAHSRMLAEPAAFVAYNPTNQAITVTFKNRVTNTLSVLFSVAGQTIASKSSTPPTTFTFKPSQITTPGGRLYLRPTTRSHTSANDRTTHQRPGHLAADPMGRFPFPRSSSDISRIMPSLGIVPVATGNCSDIDLPGGPNCANSNKAYAEWTGTFKGTLVGSKPFTQLVVYTDPALHPGWQQDPDYPVQTPT